MPDTRYLPLASASEALPPLLDTALLIRALEGLEPSQSERCPAHTMAESDFSESCIGGYGSSPSRRGTVSAVGLSADSETSLYRSHAASPVRIIDWPSGPTRWELPEISCASST